MENDLYFIQGSTLRGIGNAIRTKKGGTEEIPPLDMEAQILSISGGVNFDGLTEVYPVTELTASADLGGMATLTTAFGMVAGNVYLVCWNDTLYSCEAKEAEFGGTPVVAIGNVSALGGEDTGEPFVIGEFSEEVAAEVGINVGIMPMDGSTTFEVGVYFIAEKGSGSSDDVRYVTFMNGSEFLYKKAVATGDDCVDVLTKGLIDTPTKESTAQYDYTYADGWTLTDGGSVSSSALSNVTEDRTVYAAYTASVRYYTITYYDGETVLQTETLAYGTTPSYTPTKDGYSFTGWTPNVSNVTGDAEYYAQWEVLVGFAGMSWDQIAQVSESGEAANQFSIGDQKEVTATFDDGTTQTFIVNIVGFDHDDKSDGTGKAGITMITVSQYPEKRSMNSTATNIGGWGATAMREWCNGDLFEAFPSELQAAIKQVDKVSDGGGEDKTLKTTADKVWVPSWNEFGGGVDFDNYDDKVLEPQGAKYTFKVSFVSSNTYTRSSSINNTNGFVGPRVPYGYLSGEKTLGFHIGFCI